MKMKNNRILISKLIVLLFLSSSPLYAQNFYVDAIGGNDKNSGESKQSAWKTIDHLNCALDKNTCDIVKPYDRVYLKRNSIFEGGLDIESSSDLVLGAYGSGRMPIISHDTPADIDEVTSDNRGGLALGVSDSENIRISDLEFQGGWASIMLTDSSNIKLLRLKVGKNSQYGIVIQSDQNVPNNNNQYITINRCQIESRFSFAYSYEDSKEKRTGDGIIAYAMTKSRITNNFLKNWGHANISFDGNPLYGSRMAQEISKNLISGNYLTSPDIAYGGRIVLEDTYDNIIRKNTIVNTSVASQLGGYNNKYINNLFLNTHVPPEGVNENNPNNTAVLIEAYSSKNIYGNEYIRNKIINSEGVGLKISDAGGRDIKENVFSKNLISGCGYGVKGNNISLEIEENSEGASYSNVYKNNQILNVNRSTILYRGKAMDVNKFNRQKLHDDQIRNNIGIEL